MAGFPTCQFGPLSSGQFIFLGYRNLLRIDLHVVTPPIHPSVSNLTSEIELAPGQAKPL
ncbi:MAG: hypothetical protein H0X66_01205 [Verrucomicrobia bacterium]|nr:hypothetical protein [Verrucomicrobiota bacterium]